MTDANTTERARLVDELSAKVLAHMDTASMVADIRVQVAEANAKLDNASSQLSAIAGQLPALDVRVTKLETWQRFLMILAGAAWAVILAFISAWAFKLINGGGS